MVFTKIFRIVQWNHKIELHNIMCMKHKYRKGNKRSRREKRQQTCQDSDREWDDYASVNTIYYKLSTVASLELKSSLSWDTHTFA